MLNCLQFNMSVPTPFVFLQRFLKAAQSDKKVKILLFPLKIILNQNGAINFHEGQKLN